MAIQVVPTSYEKKKDPMQSVQQGLSMAQMGMQMKSQLLQQAALEKKTELIGLKMNIEKTNALIRQGMLEDVLRGNRIGTATETGQIDATNATNKALVAVGKSREKLAGKETEAKIELLSMRTQNLQDTLKMTEVAANEMSNTRQRDSALNAMGLLIQHRTGSKVGALVLSQLQTQSDEGDVFAGHVLEISKTSLPGSLREIKADTPEEYQMKQVGLLSLFAQTEEFANLSAGTRLAIDKAIAEGTMDFNQDAVNKRAAATDKGFDPDTFEATYTSTPDAVEAKQQQKDIASGRTAFAEWKRRRNKSKSKSKSKSSPKSPTSPYSTDYEDEYYNFKAGQLRDSVSNFTQGR